MQGKDTPIAYVINESASEPIECELVNTDNDFVIAEGILQEAEKINRNKRFYSTEDLYKEIYGPRVRELVTSGNFKGEAGHPLDLNLARQQKVDPTLEQVWFIKLWMEGPYVKAQFRGTNNPLGESFNRDLKDGQKPSFSLRSLGSLRNNNGKAQVTNLRIICYDRVYFPSYDNAYTDHIVTESTSYEDVAKDISKVTTYVKSKGNSMVVNESADCIAPIMNKDICNILIKESADLNFICEQFSPYFKKMTVNEDHSAVTIVNEDYSVIVVPIKRFIRNQIDEFCRRNG